MAAKGRVLSIALAILAIFASSSALASIARSTILDPMPGIDLAARSEEPRPLRDPAGVDASIDNAEFLHHAIDGALIAPAPVESLLESRTWVSRLERPLFVEPISPLTHTLRRGSAAAQRYWFWWDEMIASPVLVRVAVEVWDESMTVERQANSRRTRRKAMENAQRQRGCMSGF